MSAVMRIRDSGQAREQALHPQQEVFWEGKNDCMGCKWRMNSYSMRIESMVDFIAD